MDESTSPSPVPQAAGSNKNMLMIGIIVVIALAVLGGVFFMGKSKNSVPAEQAQTAVASPTPEGVVVEVTEESAPTGESVTAGDQATSNEKTFAVEASSYKFNPASITVKKGDSVKIVLTNKGGMHNWKIDEFNASTKTIPAGQTDTITFVANKAGTYEYYCSVGNHRQMGMVGKLIVQ